MFNITTKISTKTLALIMTLAFTLTTIPNVCYASEKPNLLTTETNKVIYLAGDGVGNDSNDGSEKAPFRTLQKACDNATPGTTILIHKGVYYSNDTVSSLRGTKDEPITIKACVDANCQVCSNDASLPGPVFTSKNNWKDSKETAAGDYMLKLYQSAYVNVSGLYITGYTGAGIWLDDYCDHVNVSNMNIWDIDNPSDTSYGTEGVLAKQVSNCFFENLNIWDIGQTRRSDSDHGLYISHASDCTFENLKVQDIPGGGIQFYVGDNYSIQSTNCIVKNCVFSCCNNGLNMVDVQGFKVINNTFYNSGGMDIYLDWTAKDNDFRNNIFYNDRTEKYFNPGWGGYYETPTIVGYEQNSTGTVTGNRFNNNTYQYAGAFSAKCRYWDAKNSVPVYDDVDAFVSEQNANTVEGNTYSDFNKGDIKFVGSIDSTAMLKGDDNEAKIYDNAKKLVNNALDIKSDSDCINKGLSKEAPALDILGRNRDQQVDLGAYEYQSPLTLNKANFAVGENISVNYKESTNTKDWLCITKDAGEASNPIIKCYLNGSVTAPTSVIQNGNVVMNTSLLPTGTYYLYYCKNDRCAYTAKVKFNISKNSTVVFNTNGGSAVDAQNILTGNAVLEPCVIPTKVGYTFDGWYSDETLTKLYDFSNPINGDITLFAKWKASLCDKSNYTQGEKITVAFSKAQNAKDWICINQEDKIDTPVFWCYLNGTQTAPSEAQPDGKVSIDTSSLKPGTYNLYYGIDHGTKYYAKESFNVTEKQLMLDKSTYKKGEQVTVSFRNAQNTNDWICINQYDSGAGSSILWSYLNGTSAIPAAVVPSGTVTFDTSTLSPGTYYIYYCKSDGYNYYAKQSFTVID